MSYAFHTWHEQMMHRSSTTRPDLYTYNYAISVMGDNYQAERALQLLDDITNKGIGRPNIISYNAAINACRHSCSGTVQRDGWDQVTVNFNQLHLAFNHAKTLLTP
jgi:Pentatricopeptide repeat domain